MTTREVTIKDVLDHQREDDEAPNRFKVWRWGRRRGKSVAEIKASVCGHGPIDAAGNPKFPGMVQGWAIAWLAPDFQQAKNLWTAEIKPRFLDVDGVKLTNQPPFAVEIVETNGRVYGGLYVYSFENVRAMRGLGNRLKGVIFEEAAHFDLAYAWGDVVRPMLMDNEGWAIFGSTTNAGLDGNEDKVVPSFFNRLCVEIMEGRRNDTTAGVLDWRHSHGTARDNPKISPSEFEKARAEVALKGPVAVAQEMEAELLQSGTGIAFPEWNSAIHVLPRDFTLPPGWPLFAGLDWGYEDPAIFWLAASGPEGAIIGRMDQRWQHQTPYQVGRDIGFACRRYGVPETIAYDSSMDDTWKMGGPSASSELQRGIQETLERAAPPLVPTVKEPGTGGRTYRETRKLVLHEMLAHPAVAAGIERQPWELPRLRFMVECAQAISTIPVLPRHPLNIEDVDTDANDHSYDCVTYALMGLIPRYQDDRELRIPHKNRFPGIDPATGERVKMPWEQQAGSGRFRTNFRWRKA